MKRITTKRTATKIEKKVHKDFFLNRFSLKEGSRSEDILKKLIDKIDEPDEYKLSFISIQIDTGKIGNGRDKYSKINKAIHDFKSKFYKDNEEACQLIKSMIIYWSNSILGYNYDVIYIACYHPISLEDKIKYYTKSYNIKDKVNKCSYIGSYCELEAKFYSFNNVVDKFLDKSILMIFEKSLLLDIPKVSWSELSADKKIGLSNILLGAHQSPYEDEYYIVGYTPSFFLYKGCLTYSVTQKKYRIKNSLNMFNFKDRKIILADMESDEVKMCDARKDMEDYSVLSPTFSERKGSDPRYSRLFVLQDMRRLLKACPLINEYFQEDVFSGRQSSVPPTGIKRPSDKNGNLNEALTVLYRPRDFEEHDKIKSKDGLTVKCHDINITLSVRALDNDDYSDIPDIINNHPSGFIFVFPIPKKNKEGKDIYITRRNKNTVINGGLSDNVDIIEDARKAYPDKDKDFFDFLRDFDFYTAMKLYQIVARDIRTPLSQGLSYDKFIAIKDKDVNLEKCWTELFLKTSCGNKGKGFTFDGPIKEGWKVSLNSFGSKDTQSRKSIYVRQHVSALAKGGRLIFQDSLVELDDKTLKKDCKNDGFDDDNRLISAFIRIKEGREGKKIKGDYYIIRTPDGETILIKKYPGYNSLYPLVQRLGNDTEIFSYLCRVDMARYLDSKITKDGEENNSENIHNMVLSYIGRYYPECNKDKISIEDGGRDKNKIDVCYKRVRLLTIDSKNKITFPKGLGKTNKDISDVVDLNFMARGQKEPETYFYDYETSDGLTITQVAACRPIDGIKDEVNKGSPLHEFSLYRVGTGDTFTNIGIDESETIHDILCFLLSLRTRDLTRLRHISHKNVLESFIDFMM